MSDNGLKSALGVKDTSNLNKKILEQIYAVERELKVGSSLSLDESYFTDRANKLMSYINTPIFKRDGLPARAASALNYKTVEALLELSKRAPKVVDGVSAVAMVKRLASKFGG